MLMQAENVGKRDGCVHQHQRPEDLRLVETQGSVDSCIFDTLLNLILPAQNFYRMSMQRHSVKSPSFTSFLPPTWPDRW